MAPTNPKLPSEREAHLLEIVLRDMAPAERAVLLEDYIRDERNPLNSRVVASNWLINVRQSLRQVVALEGRAPNWLAEAKPHTQRFEIIQASADRSLTLRMESFSEDDEHPEMERLVGKRVRITVEVLDD